MLLGINETFAISIGHNERKMNHLGKKLVTSLMRNTDVEIWGIGALSQYFFIRFDISGECFSMQNKIDMCLITQSWIKALDYNIHKQSDRRTDGRVVYWQF
jgi:hypothetical protein